MRKGQKTSEETKKKMSETAKRLGLKPPSPLGRHHSEEAKQKIRVFNTGKKVSLEFRKKMSEINKGEKHWNWRGGKSFEPYSIDWTKTLKRSIRERDKYKCHICGSPQEDRLHDIHHIDYDKKNCNPDNLITLCFPCHRKTNHNRENWMKYFKNRL